MQRKRQSWVPAGTFCLDRRGKLAFQCLPKLKLDFSCVVKQESPILAAFLAALPNVVCSGYAMGHSSRGTSKRSEGRDEWQETSVSLPTARWKEDTSSFHPELWTA